MNPAIRISVAGLLGLASVGSCASAERAREQEPAPYLLVVADFDQSGHLTNLGQPYGAWQVDPDDPTQFCRARLKDAQPPAKGYVLEVDYDIDSPNPAYNGVWMKLPAIPMAEFSSLRLMVRGDPERGCTRRVKLELKGSGQVARFVLDGIGPEWKILRIPLRAFEKMSAIKHANEFVIVFDEETVTQKMGRLVLDEVAFERAP